MELKSFNTDNWEQGIQLIIKDLEGKDTDVTFTIKYLESSAGKKARLDYGRKIMALKEEGKELSEVTNQDDFLDTCARVKSEYINKFSNNLKFNYLNDFLRNEKSTD